MKKNYSILGFLIVMVFQGLYSQGGCFTDYRYMQSVELNSVNPALSRFPVQVNVDTQSLIGSGKMMADASDLRIAGPDCCTELNYWIQSGLNTNSTVIWVLLDTLAPNSMTNIQLYYGNAAASGPVSNIDSVMLSLGNDLTGTGNSASGQTIGTTRELFPVDARTVRWRIYSADSASLRFKVVDSTQLVKGFSPFFTTGSAPGFYTFDWEGPTTVDGYPAWYTNDSNLSIMNNCAASTPCPGSCGDMRYTAGDVGINGNPTNMDSCGAFPSLRVWYRNFSGAFLDVNSTLSGNEIDRSIAPVASSSAVNLCTAGSIDLFASSTQNGTADWYRNGVFVGTGDTITVTQPGDYTFLLQHSGCTTDTSNVLNLTGASAILDLGPDRSECVDSSYVIDAGPGFSSYLWSNGDTTSSIEVFVTGIYWVEVTDSAACSAMDTVVITLNQNPEAVITPGPDVPICGGDAVTLDASDPNIFSYTWIPGNESSSTLEVTQGGSYSVVVVDGNFCTDTSEAVTVSFFPSTQVTLPADTVLCETDSLVLSVDNSWASVLWADSMSNMTSFTAFPPGLFWVEVTDSNGCASRDTISIQSFTPVVIDLGVDQTPCPGDLVPFDVLDPGAAFYDWSNGAFGPVISLDTSVSDLFVQATDTNGCISQSNSVNITYFPGTETPVISRDGAVLSSSVTSGDLQWFLNGAPISGATGATYTVTEPGNYAVEVSDPDGCAPGNSGPFLVILAIADEDIPEGFSPNRDGINDRFEIPNVQFFTGNKLTVYNRYGSPVFSSENYDNNWDGTLNGNGEALPDGTYFYHLDLNTGQEPISGYLIIQR